LVGSDIIVLGNSVEMLDVELGVVVVEVEEVVVEVVEAEVVVDSLHLTYSGQLQESILESKYSPGGQDISQGVRSTHS